MIPEFFEMKTLKIKNAIVEIGHNVLHIREIDMAEETGPALMEYHIAGQISERKHVVFDCTVTVASNGTVTVRGDKYYYLNPLGFKIPFTNLTIFSRGFLNFIHPDVLKISKIFTFFKLAIGECKNYITTEHTVFDRVYMGTPVEMIGLRDVSFNKFSGDDPTKVERCNEHSISREILAAEARQ